MEATLKALVEEAMHLSAVASRSDAAAKTARKVALDALTAAGVDLSPGARIEVGNGIVLATKGTALSLSAVPDMKLATALRDGLVRENWDALREAFPEIVREDASAGPIRFRPDRNA